MRKHTDTNYIVQWFWEISRFRCKVCFIMWMILYPTHWYTNKVAWAGVLRIGTRYGIFHSLVCCASSKEAHEDLKVIIPTSIHSFKRKNNIQIFTNFTISSYMLILQYVRCYCFNGFNAYSYYIFNLGLHRNKSTKRRRLKHDRWE